MSEDYDEMRKRLEEANEKIVSGFINHTVGVKKKGKQRMGKYAEHLQFFANEYLCNYEGIDLLEGLGEFPDFVGNWFIRKCMWSDESSLRENLDAFEAFLGYLEETQQMQKDRLDDLREWIDEERPLYLLRVKYYNDPEVELDEILYEDGLWDDEALMSLEDPQAGSPEMPGKGHLVLNLLLSARAAKFFKLKPPQLMKLKNWSKSWDDSSHHWISNWRCEECFGMKGTKERVFIISNEASRFSFLLRIAPGDINGLFKTLHGKIMNSLKERGVSYPSTIELQIATLSGAVPSLTTCQNHLIDYLDRLMERGEFKYIEDLEEGLNLYLTTINGSYAFPTDVFARLCEEEPPFEEDDGMDKIVPFLN